LAVGALLLMVLPRAARAQSPAPAPAQSKPATEPKQTTPANSAQQLDQARADVKQLELDVQAHRADVAAAEAHVKQAHAQLEAAQSRLRQAQARVQELEGKKPATATLKWNVELRPYTLKQGKLSLEGKPYITPQFIELPATSYSERSKILPVVPAKTKARGQAEPRAAAGGTGKEAQRPGQGSRSLAPRAAAAKTRQQVAVNTRFRAGQAENAER
jgi:hypothetical protein